MVKVLEHAQDVRWKYVCRGCASLLEFGAEDVTEEANYKPKNADGLRPIDEYLTCPVCGHTNALHPSWKRQCERVSPSEPSSGFRWKDVTKELPTKSGEYFVRNTRNDWVSIMPFSAKHQLFNVFDHWSAECVSALSSKVTHWAEIPSVSEGAKE